MIKNFLKYPVKIPEFICSRVLGEKPA